MWQVGMTLEDMEKEVIEKSLRFYSGNKTHTANALGIAIRTLDAKLEKFGIDRKLVKEEVQKERQDEANRTKSSKK